MEHQCFIRENEADVQKKKYPDSKIFQKLINGGGVLLRSGRGKM